MKVHVIRNSEHVAIGLAILYDDGKSKELLKGFGLNSHQLKLIKLQLERAYQKGRASFYKDVEELLKRK